MSNPRSQFVTLESGQNIKYLPYAFTEQGVAMLKTIFDAIRQLMTVEEKPKRKIGFRPN